MATIPLLKYHNAGNFTYTQVGDTLKVDVSTLVKDYNDGLFNLYNRDNEIQFMELSLNLINYVQGQTYACAGIIDYFGSFSTSYTARDTGASRNFVIAVNAKEDLTGFVRFVETRNNILNIKLTSNDGHWSTPHSMTLLRVSLICYTENMMNDFSMVGNDIEKDIVFKGDNSSGAGSCFEVYNNLNTESPTLIKKIVSNTETCVLKGGTITGIFPIKVVGFTTQAFTSSTSITEIGFKNTKEFNNLTVSPPTITNLSSIGNFFEKPITINWRSELQTGYEYELYYNNVRIKTGTGLTEKEFIIPANTFTGTLPASVRVRTTRRITAETLYSQWQEISITLKEIQPTVKNISLSGSNVDLPITVSWESTDQQQYVLEVWQGDTKKQTYTGTTAQSYVINAGTLLVGLTTFKVKVAYKDRWTDYATTSTTLVETLPSISVFEPDGRIVDRDLPLRIYWQSQNQSRYKLVVDGKTFNGTTEKEVNLTAGTLTSGRKQMTLTVYLDIAGKVKEVSKTVEFIVQGKPPMPTITSCSTFTTNRPAITFDSQDATAYKVDVLGVYSSGWCNGLTDGFKVGTYLENGTYMVAVTVKNQFNIESDMARKQITINAPQQKPISLKVYDNYKYNVLRIAGDYSHYYVFRNNEMIAKVYGDTYHDYTAHGKCIYKVQGITINDTCNYSNEVLVNNTFDFPVVSIEDNFLELRYRQGKSDLTCQYNPMSVKEFYMGRGKPITRHGEHSDTSYSFDYSELLEENYHKLLEMVQEKKPILYRSNKRKLWLTFDSLGIVDERIVDYSISAYEIDTNEVVDYD